MELEKFDATVRKDSDLLSRIEILESYIKKTPLLEELYDLCRATFLTQYNANFFKDEAGRISYEISPSDFKELGVKIKDFIHMFDEDDESVFKELVIILKKYYRTTAKPEEKENRAYKEMNKNDSRIGTVGTLFDLNRIDWDYFLRGLKENMV